MFIIEIGAIELDIFIISLINLQLQGQLPGQTEEAEHSLAVELDTSRILVAGLLQDKRAALEDIVDRLAVLVGTQIVEGSQAEPVQDNMAEPLLP